MHRVKKNHEKQRFLSDEITLLYVLFKCSIFISVVETSWAVKKQQNNLTEALFLGAHILFQSKKYLEFDEKQGKSRNFPNLVMICCHGISFNVKFVFIF